MEVAADAEPRGVGRLGVAGRVGDRDAEYGWGDVAGLQAEQGAVEPPYDEVLRISRPLTKADLSKLTREIFG